MGFWCGVEHSAHFCWGDVSGEGLDARCIGDDRVGRRNDLSTAATKRQLRGEAALCEEDVVR